MGSQYENDDNSHAKWGHRKNWQKNVKKQVIFRIHIFFLHVTSYNF